MVSTISKNVFTMFFFFIVSIMFTGVSSVLVGDSVMEHDKVIEKNSVVDSVVAQGSAMKVIEKNSVVDSVVAQGSAMKQEKVAHGSVMKQEKVAQGETAQKQEGFFLDGVKSVAGFVGDVGKAGFNTFVGGAGCAIYRLSSNTVGAAAGAATGGTGGCTCDKAVGEKEGSNHAMCPVYCCDGSNFKTRE